MSGAKDETDLRLWLVKALTAAKDGTSEAWFSAATKEAQDGLKVTRLEAEGLVRSSLGMLSGHFDLETARLIEKTYEAVHPIVGNAEKRSKMTMNDILDLGVRFGAAETLKSLMEANAPKEPQPESPAITLVRGSGRSR